MKTRLALLLPLLSSCASFRYLEVKADPKELPTKNGVFLTYDTNHSECYAALTDKRTKDDLALHLDPERHAVFADFPAKGSFSFHRLECGVMRYSPVLFRVDIEREGLHYLGHVRIRCEDDGLQKRCRFDLLDGRDRPAYVRDEIARLRREGHTVLSAYSQAEIHEDMIGRGESTGWTTLIQSETRRPKDKVDLTEIRAQVEKSVKAERLDNPTAFGQVQVIGHFEKGRIAKVETLTEKAGTLSHRLRDRLAGNLETLAAHPEVSRVKISVSAR